MSSEEEGGEMMYRVRKDQNNIEVIQNGDIVYSGSGDEYVIFKGAEETGKLTVKKIRDMADPELLLALATAVRIPNIVRRDSEASK